MIRTTALSALIACLPLIAAEDGDRPKPPKGDGEHRKEMPPGDGEQRKEALEKFDTNKDGKLDEAERKAMRDARTAEFKTKHPKLFAAIDADGDGALSEAEVKSLMEALRGIVPPRRQGPPDGRQGPPEGK